MREKDAAAAQKHQKQIHSSAENTVEQLKFLKTKGL